MIRNDSEERPTSPSVLVIFRSLEHRAELLEAISSVGMRPKLSDSLNDIDATLAIAADDISIVVCEDQIPQKTLQEALRQARKRATPLPVIVTSRTGEWREFLSALRQGAFDYLALPPQLSEVRRVLTLALAEISPGPHHAGLTSFAQDTAEGTPFSSGIADPWKRFPESSPSISRPFFDRYFKHQPPQKPQR